jgi:glucokinase
MKKILTADIGGTNSRFACFQARENGKPELVGTQWLKTGESGSFLQLLENLNQSDFSLRPEEADIAVFAVAGPIENGMRCSPPFISWDIDISHAREDLGIRRSFLINDFVAQAYACCSEIGENAEQVKSGKIVKDSAISVIGAGTGLGKAVIIPDGKGGYLAIPSEGGHASFPFETEQECRFREFLFKELGDTYITWNKVVSGKGISLVHEFLTGEQSNPRDVIQKILPDSETLVWASRFYGRACRNYALETLSLGGMYISGGVAARTPELVQHTAFSEEFSRSDTLSHLLVAIPVFLVTEQNAGLWGGAVFGMQKLKEAEREAS